MDIQQRIKPIKTSGGMRIAKKESSGITTDKKRINHIIDSLNGELMEINDANFHRFKAYLMKFLEDFTKQVKRYIFKDRDEYRLMKNDKIGYILNRFFIAVDPIRIILKKETIYDYGQSTFNKQGCKFVDTFLEEIKKIIETKQYLPYKPEKDYKKDEFDKCLELLDLEKDKKLLFSTIKEGFHKKSDEYQDDDDKLEEVNKAFITLRNQYQNYLKSFSYIRSDTDSVSDTESVSDSDSVSDTELNTENTENNEKENNDIEQPINLD